MIMGGTEPEEGEGSFQWILAQASASDAIA